MKRIKFFVFSIFLLTVILACCANAYASEPDANLSDLNSFFILPQLSLQDTSDKFEIRENHAILQGKKQQMEIANAGSWGYIEWSSSNNEIISCSIGGEIKGIREGKATITAKTKNGKEKDSIVVYCAKKLNNITPARPSIPFSWTCKKPSFFSIQSLNINIFPIIVSPTLNVAGIYGSYFYVTFTKGNAEYEGFIKQSWMPVNIASDELFRQIST